MSACSRAHGYFIKVAGRWLGWGGGVVQQPSCPPTSPALVSFLPHTQRTTLHTPKHTPANTYTAIQVDEYAWRNPDFLPVFAAGNDGDKKASGGLGAMGGAQGRQGDYTVTSPANAKNILSVGATQVRAGCACVQCVVWGGRGGGVHTCRLATPGWALRRAPLTSTACMPCSPCLPTPCPAQSVPAPAPASHRPQARR